MTQSRLASDPGYEIVEQVFSPRESADVLSSLADAPIARTRAGVRHALAIPSVRALAADARMLSMAGAFVGPSPVPFRATLFDKSLASNWLVVWHQDTALPLTGRGDDPAWGPWSTKAGVLYAHAPAWALDQIIALRVHLDDSTVSNGPLRLLPGTHTRGVLIDSEIAQLARDVRPVDCVAPRGGVVAMRPLTIHASSKAADDRPRRVLHIEYASALVLAPAVELAVG